MTSLDLQCHAAPPHRPLGSLPARMRLLYVTSDSRETQWLGEALSADPASVVQLDEALGAEAGLARLRDEVFDAIVLSHVPGMIDALEMAEGIRSIGVEEPILILGEEPAGEFSALVYEIGADAYLHTPSTTTRTMLWTVSQMMDRNALLKENRRLAQCEKNRLRQEQEDAAQLLADQRSLVGEVPATPEDLKAHYRQLLRTHVIMGTGNLNDEIEALALLLSGAQISSHEVIALHLDTLEELLRGLGNRSVRHIFTRADVLILDVLARLADQYRDGNSSD
jgi:DNA-binding response OmpR family regulator